MRPPPPHPALPWLAALGVMLMWASSFLVIRVAGNDFSPGAMTLLRVSAASIALLPLLLVGRVRAPRSPRLWAAVLTVPLLVGVGDTIGIMGGWLVGTRTLGFPSATWLRVSWQYLEAWDVASGLIKGAVFGLIVALSGCWFGMRAGRGAAGVGRATTSAVVAASVGILAANFVLTGMFFS